tara:strand:+ start:71 stop:574 length:504 start_codon:yes stop_codon:yes gene_type:complete
MKILTLENVPYTLERIPEYVNDDLRFAVLDNSNPADPDYFWIPLIFLESFNAPAAVLQIGKYKIKMPLDWKMIVGEPEQGELNVLPITSLNDRGFDAFLFNPLTSSKPDFAEIDIVDIYQEVKWYFPKIKTGQILAVPLENKRKPQCAYFVKDISRQCENIDYGSVW